MLLLCGCYSLVWLWLQNLLLLYGCRLYGLPCRHVLIQQHKHYCCSKVKQGAINNSGIATLPTQTSAVACSKQGQPGILSHAHIILDGMTKNQTTSPFHTSTTKLSSCYDDWHAWWTFRPTFHTSLHPCICYCLQYVNAGPVCIPSCDFTDDWTWEQSILYVHTQFAACILQYKTKFQILIYADKSLLICPASIQVLLSWCHR